MAGQCAQVAVHGEDRKPKQPSRTRGLWGQAGAPMGTASARRASQGSAATASTSSRFHLSARGTRVTVLIS